VLAAATAVADEVGIERLTMRLVADRLDVEAMALYRHVASKDALLEGLVESVVDEVSAACATLDEPQPGPGEDWRAVARRRILTAREVVLRHPWFPSLISARGTMGGSLLRYFDAFSGILLAGGLSPELLHRALHTLGSRVLGFTQELFAPDAPALADPDEATAALEAVAADLPSIARMMAVAVHDADTTIGWCDDQAEFEFGLDVTLDGLEARRREEAGRG